MTIKVGDHEIHLAVGQLWRTVGGTDVSIIGAGPIQGTMTFHGGDKYDRNANGLCTVDGFNGLDLCVPVDGTWIKRNGTDIPLGSMGGNIQVQLNSQKIVVGTAGDIGVDWFSEDAVSGVDKWRPVTVAQAATKAIYEGLETVDGSQFISTVQDNVSASRFTNVVDHEGSYVTFDEKHQVGNICGDALDPWAVEGYESLARVLLMAFAQSAHGKGKERHAQHNEPFIDQVIMEGARRYGLGAPLFQAYKKAEEAQRLDFERAKAELLGAIVYLAAGVLLIEEKQAEDDKNPF